MNNAYLHKLTYIDWLAEGKLITVTNEEFVKKYNELKEKRIVAKSKTIREDYMYDNSYRLTVVGKYKRLYFHEGRGNYVIYSTDTFDNDKNKRNQNTGSVAVSGFNILFNGAYGLKRNGFNKVFGTADELFKNCVPQQFYYINDKILKNKLNIFKNVSSIDATSHYPACAKGILPTTKGMKTVNGRVEPNSEYPFAFYPETGHIAIFNEFDTHNWLNSEFADRLFERNCKDKSIQVLGEETITFLMKKATVKVNDRVQDKLLDPIWEQLFEVKNKCSKDSNDYIAAKLMLNSTIGCWHMKKSTAYKKRPYAHLAAVIIARANQKMLDMCDKICPMNILHLCVDGIIYKGSVEFGTHNKVLGGFEQEITNSEFGIIGYNKYMFVKDGQLIKYKHSGCNAYKDGTNIDERQPKEFKDMLDWVVIKEREIDKL